MEGQDDPLIGTQLGSYIVRRWIGQGGMGVVYSAEQPDIGKTVAIKVLKADVASDPDNLKQLKDEARTVNAIRHRGIIDIFGFGTTPDGREYIVMEYLEGEPLDVYLARRKKLAAHEVATILDEVLSALGAAHKAGVVHRDLKPGNIFVAMQSDGTQYVKVLDFGLAKKAQRPYGSAAQTAFRPVGTPEYMAPEQARGESVGPRTDLYSVGIIAFELLTGDIPFNAGSLVEILMKQVQEPPPSPRSLEPTVPAPLEALVLELLAKQPQARPSSAEIVRRRLKQLSRFLKEAETWAGQPARAIPSPPAEPTDKTIGATVDGPTQYVTGPAPASPTRIVAQVVEPLEPVRLRPLAADEPTHPLPIDETDAGRTPVSPPPRDSPIPETRVAEPPKPIEPRRSGEKKAVPVRASPATEEVSAPRAVPTQRDLTGRRSRWVALLFAMGAAGLIAALSILYLTGRLGAAAPEAPGPGVAVPQHIEPEPEPEPAAEPEAVQVAPPPIKTDPPPRPAPVAPALVKTPRPAVRSRSEASAKAGPRAEPVPAPARPEEERKPAPEDKLGVPALRARLFEKLKRDPPADKAVLGWLQLKLDALDHGTLPPEKRREVSEWLDQHP